MNKNSEIKTNIHIDSKYFKEWHLYHTIVKINAMFHYELYNSIKGLFPTTEPFSLCDLGCGSSDYIAKTLPTEQKIHYTGVDMSASALECASHILSQHHAISAHFIQTDMISFLTESIALGKKYDCIFSGFAIHHLSLSQKEEVISLIAQVLNKNGKFILIDIFIPEGHQKSYYFETLMSLYYSRLKVALTQEEIAATQFHNENFDYPEHLSFYESIAAKNGFTFSVFLTIEGYFSSMFHLV